SKKTGVLTVPTTALRHDAGNPIVYAIENGKLVPKPVTLGLKGNDADGAAVEVTGGLENGARIVRTNLGKLQSGTAVKFAETPPENAPAHGGGAARGQPN
ncbi:MAG TPA: hypothetical protein VHK70_06160, partial [Burkholderiaceae bacterium]|nr:hypothetical protein [Burkholderiaceae bacterium]